MWRRAATMALRMRHRDDGKITEGIMKQQLPREENPSSSKNVSLIADTELSKRVLKRVQKLMYDAIHLQNPDMPDKSLVQLREEYERLDWDHRRKALKILSTEFGVDKRRVTDLIQRYLFLHDEEQNKDGEGENPLEAAQFRAQRDLRATLLPLSVRLFEQMNGQTGGLKFLVDLRADILCAIRDENHPALKALDLELRALFSTWLSPACLELHQLTWNDAASLLEKIVRYEAVHPINNLYDLKRRLGTGRRCFGYIHPAMPGEPLVFIEVALTDNVSHSIQEVLFDKPPISEDDATHAIFYGISSTQAGLSGIDLGNFLIKRVLRLLLQDMPQIKIFSTLSPIPFFLKWLMPKLAAYCSEGNDQGTFKEKLLLVHEETALKKAYGGGTNGELIMYDVLGASDPQWADSEKLSAALQAPLMRLCARYLLQEKKRGKALDPVANFHLRNGASIERLNWMGDNSTKGLKQSAGLMVNYFYRVESIAENNQLYMSKGIITASSQVEEHLIGGQQCTL